jgi:hypothetical protein
LLTLLLLLQPALLVIVWTHPHKYLRSSEGQVCAWPRGEMTVTDSAYFNPATHLHAFALCLDVVCFNIH